MKRLTAFLLALVAILAAPAALAAAATQFRVTSTSPTTQAGTAITVIVEAIDAAGAIDTGYTGTIALTSSDPLALIPTPTYTFVTGDAGVRVFPGSITLRSAGPRTITASSTTGTLIQGTSGTITVTGGTAATLSVTAPSAAAANTAFNVTVSAKDAFGNAATGYTGTIRFTTTDAAATPPANTTLTNGTVTVSATLKTVGKQRITATDTVTASLTATSAEIDVTIPPAQLTLAPTSLDFGGQSMKTTAPALAVTLTNSGGVATNVSSIAASTYFAVTHDCTTVNPGAFCTASVTFTPTAEGALTGTLTIVSGAGTQTVALAGTGEKSLVTHYYRSILRRAPDAAGKSFWNAEASRVTALGANVNETWYAMSGSFYFSSEYLAFARSNADFVTDLYNTFFNRAPDTAGFNDWTTKLSQGMPREVVLASFMFSPEFTTFTKDIFGTAVVRPEIDMDVDFYRGILGRLPDDAGFNSWLTRLRNSQCAGAAAVSLTVEDISSQFALSAEYSARNRNNSQYVGDLYNAFLRRGGDLAGVQFWIDEIASGRQTREAVRKQFVASPEFSGRANAVIAAGCFSSPPTVDTDITGNPIPAPTGPAGARMCEEFGGPSPGSGPGPCGSYQIAIGNCSSGLTGANAISKAWMYVLEDYTPTSPRLGNSIRWGMARDNAMVFRFKTGPVSAFPNTLLQNLNHPLTISYGEYTSLGPMAPRFMTLSETKCDFDYSKTLSNGVLNGCYKTSTGDDSLLATITPTGADPNVGFPFCQLKPNTTYYVNVRLENATTVPNRGNLGCPVGTNCGQTMGFN